jgi:hypothetical protein
MIEIDEMQEEAELRMKRVSQLMGQILDMSKAVRVLWGEGRVTMHDAQALYKITYDIDMPFQHGYRSLRRKDYETVDWCLNVMEIRHASAEAIYDEILRAIYGGPS